MSERLYFTYETPNGDRRGFEVENSEDREVSEIVRMACNFIYKKLDGSDVKRVRSEKYAAMQRVWDMNNRTIELENGLEQKVYSN